jgi:ABC-type branched-subunit amino acid transport system permease subunit
MTSIQPIEPSTTLIPEKNLAKTLTVGIITAVLVIAAPMIIGTAGGNYWVRVLDFAMLYVMLALGLNVVVGFAGLLDLGYIAFYAVGAYTAALLSSPHLSSNSNGSRISRRTGCTCRSSSSCRARWAWPRCSASCSAHRRCVCAATTSPS